MNKECLKDEVWDLSFNASMFQHYYEFLRFRFWIADKIIKASLAFLAAIGVAMAAMPQSSSVSWWSFWLSVATLFVATLLNFLPLDEREKEYADFHRRFSELRAKVGEFEIEVFGTSLSADYMIRTKGKLGNEPVTSIDQERLKKLLSELYAIRADEGRDWPSLNTKAQQEENQRRWGPGVKTAKQVGSNIKERRDVLVGAGSSP